MNFCMKYGVLWLLIVPVLGGCASRYCQRSEQVYEKSVERATLQSPEGLKVPEPDPNFTIPNATGENVQYATSNPGSKGRDAISCLDTPPNLIVVTPPPELDKHSESEPELPAEPEDDEPGVNETDEEAPESDPVQL